MCSEEYLNKYTSTGLVLAGFYLFGIFMAVVTSEHKNLISAMNSLGSFLSAGGAVAAILSVLQVSHLRKLDRAKDRTDALIEECSSLLADTEMLLFSEHGIKNNRTEWIVAAENIKRVKELIPKIQIEIGSHGFEELDIKLSALVERFQFKLYQRLKVRRENQSSPLPVQFFYGVEDWETCTIEDAKKANEKGSSCAYWDNEDSVAPMHGITKLSRSSVFEVGHFILMFCDQERANQIKTFETFPEIGEFEGMAKYMKYHT
ncbi:hypothetical protein D5E86_24825 [Vibrio parahaemolyticus]|nr:hypothetical protein D5E86_24825 [Vibrio parahaemolyticus]